MTAIGTYIATADLKVRLGIGTADTTDDTLLGVICGQVNSYIESVTERVVAPIGGTVAGTLLYDVPQDTDHLYIKEGIRALTTLEIAAYSGAAYSTVTSGDVFLSPPNPRPGWPYDRIYISDVPTGSIAFFPKGLRTVRIVATTGFAAVPDDLAEMAAGLAVRTWEARKTGQSDVIGTDAMGQPIVSRLVSARDKETLLRYRVGQSAV